MREAAWTSSPASAPSPPCPFAGIYQLVDFPLSNLAHSGITDVWLSVSYLGSSLEQEVANGRPWDLDRNRGGLRLLMPQEGTGSTDEEGFAQGNADELYRLRDQIRAARPDVLLVMSADHVYRFDYQDAIATHLEAGRRLHDRHDRAAARRGRRPRVRGGRHRWRGHRLRVQARRAGARPRWPPRSWSTTPRCWSRSSRSCTASSAPDSPAGDSGLEDFGDHLLPRLVERHHVVAHALPGYWRDVGQPHKYVEAHRELLRDDRDVFDHPGWPILTRQPQRAPARVLDGAVVVDSLLSPGLPGRGPGRAQRPRPGRRRRGRCRGPRQRGLPGHGRGGPRDRGLGGRRRALPDRRGRAGGRAADADPDGSVDPDMVSVLGRETSVPAGATLDPGSRLGARHHVLTIRPGRGRASPSSSRRCCRARRPG